MGCRRGAIAWVGSMSFCTTLAFALVPVALSLAAMPSSTPAASEPTAPDGVPAIPIPEDFRAPLQLDLLKPNLVLPANIITSHSPSATQMTLPSLWWVAEQITSKDIYGNKFLQGWIAYRTQDGNPGRLDIVVNRQLWSQLIYVEHYAFLDRFSTIARGYGFNIRVFDSQRNPVAAYVCDFSNLNASALHAPDVATSGTRDTLVDQLPCRLAILTDSAARPADERLRLLIRSETRNLEPSQP
jgi:hypothetical protein